MDSEQCQLLECILSWYHCLYIISYKINSISSNLGSPTAQTYSRHPAEIILLLSQKSLHPSCSHPGSKHQILDIAKIDPEKNDKSLPPGPFIFLCFLLKMSYKKFKKILLKDLWLHCIKVEKIIFNHPSPPKKVKNHKKFRKLCSRHNITFDTKGTFSFCKKNDLVKKISS